MIKIESNETSNQKGVAVGQYYPSKSSSESTDMNEACKSSVASQSRPGILETSLRFQAMVNGILNK